MRCDIIIDGALVVTMDSERRALRDGAIAVTGGEIAGVGPAAEVRERFDAGTVLDGDGLVALPGLVNAHIHLTGPSLFPGAEPGDAPLAEHFPRWVLPAHEHSTVADERAAARLVGLQLLRTGTTAFLEAAGCRDPVAVAAAVGELGLRGALGSWVADGWPEPPSLATDTAGAIERLRRTTAAPPSTGRVALWPNVVGHTGCSDELVCEAAALARRHGTGWTIHMSAFADDGDAFRERTGRDPLVHLDALGVLDEHCTIGHGIHLSDAEVGILRRTGATVAFCPPTALRLATGVSRVGRHPELPHVALGTDTQNASNHLDLLRAGATAVETYAEATGDRATLTAQDVLAWATRGGARALGLDDLVGSLEPGKRADVVLVDPRQPVRNIEMALVHGSPVVRDVLIDGERVVADGRVPGEGRILAEAEAAAERVAARAGVPAATGWLSAGGP